MKRQTKQTSQEQEQLAETQSHQAAVREFASEKELLQHDARQTPVPPAVAKRLAQSIQAEPKPTQSWWRRLTGG